MKNFVIILVIIGMLCFSITGAGISVSKNLDGSNDESHIELSKTSLTTFEKSKDTIQSIQSFSNNNFEPYNELNNKKIVLPWVKTQSDDILEWYVKLVYNGVETLKKVDISINDFKEQFLKHPEYGKILRFDLDDDSSDDVEVIIGFYWSIIKDQDGLEQKSLETRVRVRQLESGGYLDDSDGELEVWSELHVNWGLVKENGKGKTFDKNLFSKIYDNFFSKFNDNNYGINRIFNVLFEKIKDIFNINDDKIVTTASDSDYFTIGAGYRSPQGEDIPRYTEKRFAFAKDRLFNPSIFQHKTDPADATGQDKIDLLYGFKSYKGSSNSLQYDIEFSVEFEPAVYLITKFVPVNGQVYYYFDQNSRRSSDTKITFASNILKGSGEDATVSLVFDEIDDSLGRTGRWLMFDIDLIDFDPLGGAFSYKASHKFDVGILVNAPGFSEKVKVAGIPTRADVSWDLDFLYSPGGITRTEANGFADLSMSSNLDGIKVFYPRENENDPEKIFIEVEDVPSARVSGVAKLHIDLGNFNNPSNYIFGKISQSASSSLDKVAVYLKNHESPILDINNVPSQATGEAGLYWNHLKGHAYGSSSGGASMALDITYGSFEIVDVLQINSGHLSTSFKISDDGYFGLDSSNKMISNDLTVNTGEGDYLSLSIGNIDADNFKANWEFDSSGKISDIGFSGMIDTLEDVELSFDYQGKSADLSLNWNLGKTGYFDIEVDQLSDLTLDFSDFAPDSNVFYLDGGLTISSNILFDMSWDFKQGSGTGTGSIDPGYFKINQYNDDSIIKNLDFIFTYNDNYGVDFECVNLGFYLSLEWWKGQRILPYVWLDYEVSADALDLNLLLNGDWYDVWEL